MKPSPGMRVVVQNVYGLAWAPSGGDPGAARIEFHFRSVELDGGALCANVG